MEGNNQHPSPPDNSGSSMALFFITAVLGAVAFPMAWTALFRVDPYADLGKAIGFLFYAPLLIGIAGAVLIPLFFAILSAIMPRSMKFGTLTVGNAIAIFFGLFLGSLLSVFGMAAGGG